MTYKAREFFYDFSRGGAIAGAFITLLLLASGVNIVYIGTYTILNLIVLGYIIHTGGAQRGI